MPAVEDLVTRARAGEVAALDELVRVVQDDVYGLAIRMLWHPHDAEDATQEILVRVVTRLSTFRGESSFRTWVFRVAANHLLTTRRRRAELPQLTFDGFADDLADGLDTPYDAGPEEELLAEEVKIGCTHAMLLCLDREHRLAFILGDVFELPGEEAAAVLAIGAAAYRKRLSRARERIRSFMAGHCGLVNAARPCRCRRRVGRAIAVGRVDPSNLFFAPDVVRRGVKEMESLHDAAAIFRSHPRFAAPAAVAERVMELLQSPRYATLVRP